MGLNYVYTIFLNCMDLKRQFCQLLYTFVKGQTLYQQNLMIRQILLMGNIHIV